MVALIRAVTIGGLLNTTIKQLDEYRKLTLYSIVFLGGWKVDESGNS